MTEFRLAIDAGHGGPDAGAVHNGIVEADYVLEIAARYMVRLAEEQPDWEAIVLRGEAEDPYKSIRDDRARRFGAHMVQSVHVDGVKTPTYRGSTVFVWSGNERARLVAEATNQALPRDLWSTRKGPRGVYRLSPREDKYPDAAHVVGGFTPPTVLLECGYSSNPANAAFLKTDMGKDSIVDALMAGAVAGAKIYGVK